MAAYNCDTIKDQSIVKCDNNEKPSRRTMFAYCSGPYEERYGHKTAEDGCQKSCPQ